MAIQARYAGICTRTGQSYAEGTLIQKGNRGWEIAFDREAVVASTPCPDAFYAGSSRYVCRVAAYTPERVEIVITSDSTGKDQLAYDVNTRTFENRRAKAWNSPAHRKEIEDAFLSEYLTMPVQETPVGAPEVAAPQPEKSVEISVTWTDKQTGYHRGEVFENTPGQFLKVVSIHREYIREDGYSMGLDIDEGNIYTALCIPALQTEIDALLAKRESQRDPDVFRTERSMYKVTTWSARTPQENMAIRPYAPVSGMVMADSIATYRTQDDVLVFRGVAEINQPAIEAAFRQWLKGRTE